MEILNRPRGFGWHSVLVGASASAINCPDQPLVIGLAFQVSGCLRLRPADTVSDRQPDEDKAVADAIESSPPEAPHYFERRVRDLSYDFWFSEAFSRASLRWLRTPSTPNQLCRSGFIAAVVRI
jgi:hypothetical protein